MKRIPIIILLILAPICTSYAAVGYQEFMSFISSDKEPDVSDLEYQILYYTFFNRF
jgi:hypothetical protein